LLEPLKARQASLNGFVSEQVVIKILSKLDFFCKDVQRPYFAMLKTGHNKVEGVTSNVDRRVNGFCAVVGRQRHY
jgi:hypothetical protein